MSEEQVLKYFKFLEGGSMRKCFFTSFEIDVSDVINESASLIMRLILSLVKL